MKEQIEIEGWVARNYNNGGKEGSIYLFEERPNRNSFSIDGYPTTYFWTSDYKDCLRLPTNAFPFLTWEDEPKKVSITIITMEE